MRVELTMDEILDAIQEGFNRQGVIVDKKTIVLNYSQASDYYGDRELVSVSAELELVYN